MTDKIELTITQNENLTKSEEQSIHEIYNLYTQ